MQFIRFSALAAGVLISGLVQAEVRVEGPVEYGVFVSDYQDYQAGERVLTRSNQPIEVGDAIPAKLGTKFGVRYNLVGKTASEAPLTLLYLTPGVVTPDGKRHDKFVVTQKLVVGAPDDVMAFEFTEPHEVVAGEWHFMVFQDDRKLLEQRFTVR
ncbi:DUF3859 domain-containing protein [Pseudomonas sp. HMWF032]|uniref:DUF3859 domain-containing protein n=1 Tax=Pseudomonas sp. HMWF032 TaxID=2056866 RepID=UPI000D3BA05A|nr:DUF3859 domain-containing protein [Pseudomonas sp. HMWF032]PTS86333.1 DUF3859 domain-containing protein [Pseudomonas sp. HMWF032]PTT82811.1 DUF3859 domain-containing protein [Pseudomonas sp. HMWF010]